MKTVPNFLTRNDLKILKKITNKCFKLFKKIITQRWNVWKKERNLHGCKSLTEACFKRKDPNNGKTWIQWTSDEWNK